MAENALPLARIVPAQRMVSLAQDTPPRRNPTPRQKAAIIVRFLLAEGGNLPISALPDHMQTALAEQMGHMRLVDRATLDSVVAEFVSTLEGIGIAFPGGIEEVLNVMDGHISHSAASRLRRNAGMNSKSDPWERLISMSADQLIGVIQDEAVEVAAVALSKLPVPKAADILGRLPGERARRIAFAVSQTGNVAPETVRRIGAAILSQIDSQPARAFDIGPVERVGAILNISPASTRDDVLMGLEAEDAAFAQLVRKAIFTFAHLPNRIQPRDIPKIIRLVEQPVLVTAMTASQGKDDLVAATEFILANISQRMAQGIREEIAARGKVKDKDAEEAMTQIISAIRTLEASGDLILVQPDEE